MREMHWFVYVEDVNAREIIVYDVFSHGRFAEDVRKAYKKHRMDFDAFTEKVRGSLFYYYRSKCEWEVIVGSWVASDRIPERKVDVYDQVMLNWDVFIKYVWEQAHARKWRGE